VVICGRFGLRVGDLESKILISTQKVEFSRTHGQVSPLRIGQAVGGNLCVFVLRNGLPIGRANPLIVLGIDHQPPTHAFTFALGMQVGFLTQGEVNDSPLAG
jgi:hypothetical protein